MIWATDREGQVLYVSPEWTVVTGQSRADALGDGWLAVVHPDDRTKTLSTFRAALRVEKTFGLTYRLQQADGAYIWVAAGAVASHGPPAASFLGFLGSVTMISPEMAAGSSSIMIGAFNPPDPHPHTQAHGLLDLLADHLIIAHAIAAENGGKTARPFIAAALAQVKLEMTWIAPGGGSASSH